MDEPGLEDDPNISAQRHEFTCDIQGVNNCESALFIDVTPGLLDPRIVFQAYDLEAREGDGLSIYFSDHNWSSPIQTPADFTGIDVEFTDILNSDVRGPHVHFVENLGDPRPKLWEDTGQSVSPIYDPKTRTLLIEWDLDLYSVREPPPDPVQRREVGSAKSPILIRCWKATGSDSAVQDVNFETEGCKPWKKYDTASL